MKKFAICILCLLAVSCSYGPAHLNGFYSQRNRYQSLIDDIEQRYSLKSRDADKEKVPALEESISRLEKENGVLKAQLEVWKAQGGAGRADQPDPSSSLGR